jgi:hypothetical protein
VKRLNISLVGALITMANVNAPATTRYVDAHNPSPAPPHTNWASAARIIQEAVDAAQTGDEVVVTNGIYETGGRAVVGTTTNRVAVDRPLIVRSANGPEVTTIRGYALPNGPNGDGAIRCAYLTNGATLSGFTLTGGATRCAGDLFLEQSGGGAWCEPGTTVITNCMLISNRACLAAGGVLGGNVRHCTIAGNLATYGAGVSDSALDNCVLRDNAASHSGGGALGSMLDNCTLVGNSAPQFGGGLSHCGLRNCIVYFNTAPEGPNYDNNSSLDRCCTFPPPEPHNSVNSITNEPLFVDWADGNLRLQGNSPCVNAGLNEHSEENMDRDGKPRIVGGTVDLGAYEFQGTAPAVFYDWLQDYGLLPDGSADNLDSDLDGHNNWQEWQCGTVPTNGESVLRLLCATRDSDGVVVQWASVTGRDYWLERATNLGAPAPFSLVASNISGGSGVTAFVDATATNSGRFFYRVGVGW